MEKKKLSCAVLDERDIHMLREMIEADNQIYSSEQISGFINTKGNIAFAAKRDEKIIGLAYCYSLLRLDGRLMMYVYSVDILKAYQNNGYGTELMKYVINYAKNNGYSKCYVPVEKSNAPACKIYKKAGMISGNDCLEYKITF